MDRERFDALTRALAAKGSRRGAFATLLGVAFLGQSPDALAGRGKSKGGHGKSRGHGGHKGNGKNHGHDTDRSLEAQNDTASAQEIDLQLASAGDESAITPNAVQAASRNGNGKHRRRGQGNGKGKGRAKKAHPDGGDGQAQKVQAQAGGCCGNKGCTNPGKASYSQDCNFAGSDFSGTDATAANLLGVDGRKTVFSTQAKPGNWYRVNFSYACLGEAKFAYADLRKVNFAYACLADADLSNAQADSSTNYTNAILCRTKMPDGSASNRDCNSGTSCCPTCSSDAQCGSGRDLLQWQMQERRLLQRGRLRDGDLPDQGLHRQPVQVHADLR